MPCVEYLCDNCQKEFLIRSSLRNGNKHYCSRVCAHLGRINDLFNSKTKKINKTKKIKKIII